MRRLILRPGAIGDCILCFPALEHLATEVSEIWISAPVAPLVSFASSVRTLSSTGIDLVGVGDLQTSAAIAETIKSYDEVVSWYGANRPEFREALASLGVPCRFLQALPPADFRQHASAFFSGQVGANREAIPRIRVGSVQARGTIVVHPFSGSQRKNWPLSHYEQLAHALGRQVEWTAGPEESLDRAHRFDSLAQLAKWLTGAKLFIGNDSGIAHLAAALGIPTLALFGPTDPAVWAPRGSNVAVLRSVPIEQLQVSAVLAAANRLLAV